MVFVSESEKDTLDIAARFAQSLSGGEVVALNGELGAGKTVFVKGLCRALGVGDEVLSPTFTLMREYSGASLFVRHYDAYRLSGGEEAYMCGLADFFGDKSGVCVIEWAEKIEDAFRGLKPIRINIRRTGENAREIEVIDGKDKS